MFWKLYNYRKSVITWWELSEKDFQDGSCLKKFTPQKLSEKVSMIRFFLKVYIIRIVWKGLLDM